MNDIRPPRRPALGQMAPRPATAAKRLPGPTGFASPQTVTPQPAPIRPLSQPSLSSTSGAVPLNSPTEPASDVQVPVAPLPDGTSSPRLALPSPKKRRILWWVLGGLLVVAMGVVLSAWAWYDSQLKPVDAASKTRTRITITSGSSPATIGQLLQQKKLIKNTFAFDLYTRLSGKRAQLKAGTYSLSPSESTPGVVAHLVSGKTDTFSITFLPGATLAQNKKVLVKAGYSEQEVSAALNGSYDLPLFTGKPAKNTFEGYIYGETYQFDTSATPRQILTKSFNELAAVVKDNNLEAGFKAQGLSLYEGIIIASIIQREVPNATDQKQVAQIFLKRYNMDMPLGSDVTAYYGADLIGAERAVTVDTPYNTRIHAGLPPGPIASPGLTALLAVAHPAQGDYVYFLSGDDEKTYYARTADEHEANIQNHCHIKCALP